MSNSLNTHAANPRAPRLSAGDLSLMTDAQRAAAQAIIDGPRKGIYGVYTSLVYAPALTDAFGTLGAKLRFEGVLSDAVRELMICFISRENTTQFEYQMHAKMAVDAGVPQAAMDDLAAGRVVHGLPAPLQIAFDFASELVRRKGVSDPTFAAAKAEFGDTGVVELTAVIGFFNMACWIMNVGGVPPQKDSSVPELVHFPA